MTDFAFRIRAIDDTGAFADRDFSIKVRNTVTDRMVLVDGTNAYTSPDGVNWTTRAGQGGFGVAHGGGMWLVWAGTTYKTSPDGVNWTTRSLPANGGVPGSSSQYFTYANGRWMTYWIKSGMTSTNPTAYTSLDGINWTEGGVILNAPSASRIVYGNGRWFICNNAGSPTNGFTSTDDGVTWSTVSTGFTAQVSDAIFVNGLWILVDFAGARVLTSSNFTTWTARSLPGLVGFAARIAYGNGRLVIPPYVPSGNPVSGYDKVMTSEDGVTWTARTFPAFKPGSSGTSGPHTPNIVYTHGQFYMVSNSGGAGTTDSLRVSKDGITWTRPATPGGFYNGIARMSLS